MPLCAHTHTKRSKRRFKTNTHTHTKLHVDKKTTLYDHVPTTITCLISLKNIHIDIILKFIHKNTFQEQEMVCFVETPLKDFL